MKPPVPNVVATDDDMEDEPRRAHLVVDDPGVDENKPSQKPRAD